MLIDESGFRGLEAKTVGDGNWFVINETWRVPVDSATYEISKNTCSNCGRAGVTGLFDYLSQIEVPAESGIFFTPTFDRRGSWNGNRDLFATEDIAIRLKERGIKGGYFTRLLDRSEEEAMRKRIAGGKLFKLPKGALIEL